MDYYRSAQDSLACPVPFGYGEKGAAADLDEAACHYGAKLVETENVVLAHSESFHFGHHAGKMLAAMKVDCAWSFG